MLAITLGVYERGISAISHFLSEFKQNFRFLLYLGLGICFGIILGSKIVLFFLNRFYLQTMLLFIGMIIGGLRPVLNGIKQSPYNLKYFLVAFIIFLLLVLLSLLDSSDGITRTVSYSASYIFIMILCGVVDAAATVIPGISGTALLMLIGYYNVIMTSYSTLFNITEIKNNIFTIVPYAGGMLIGIVVVSKLMDYLMHRHKILTNYMILGFSISSIILLLLQTFAFSYNILTISISLVALLLGYYITIALDK